MSLTNDQLLDRIVAIEDTLTTIQTALNNLAAKKTLNAAMGLKQQEIEALKSRVTELESQISALQQNV